MRGILVVALFVSLCPAGAMAQSTPLPTESSGSPPAAAPSTPEPRARGRDIKRDEYIERAKHNAEKRFDRMDTNHDGVLTIEERRAARAKRRHKSEPE